MLHHKMLKQFLEISDDLSNKTRTNSSRAARAREKLLKLSGAQFRELSTDVYDELRRRIDESRGEPDFLLPKSSFHPKRNQARQKLSSLPQSRFKDLVLDISYEIERRNLHVPAVNANNTTTNNNNNNTNSHNTMSTSSDSRHSNQSFSHNRQQSADVGSHINSFDHSRNVSIGTRGLKEQQPHQLMQSASLMRHQQHQNLISELPRGQPDQPSIGVQSTTVIPSKANLTWSSDEEDDDEDLNGTREDSFKGVNKRSIVGDTGNGGGANGAGIAAGFASGAAAASAVDAVSSKSAAELKELSEKNSQLDTLVNSLQAKLEEAQHDKEHLESKIKLLQEDYDYSNTQNKELSKELEELSSSKNQWLTEKEVYDKKIEDNQLNYIHKSEYESLKSNLGALRLENQSLKNSVYKDRHQRTASNDFALQLQQKQIQLDEDSSSGSANAGGVKKDVERLLEQLGNIDTSRSGVKKGGEQSVIDLKMDVAKWQLKYEEIRSGHISKDLHTKIMKSDDLKPFISPQGSISFKLVADLLAFVETFLNYLGNDDTFDSDFLFEKISKISVTANAIAAQGDDASLNSNENSILLREAVSYALTSTRYYAVYSNILPKVIVERSLGEICFCLCDLISISKLNTNEIGDNKYGGGLKVIQKNDESINSGVRPLRMANRLREQSNLSPTNDRHEIIVPKIIPTQVDNDSNNTPSKAKGISSLSSRFDRKREEVEPEVTPKPKSTPPRVQMGSGVAHLSKRLSDQAESSPNSSPSRITPTKSNNSIFDKVRQFETSPNNDDYIRGINGSPESLKKVSEDERGLSGAFRANGSGKDKIEESEPKPVGKGIFQSLRQKLVSADNNEDLNNSDEKVDTSVNDTMTERDANSTNHTTPYNDNHSIGSVKSESGKGFFLSIRQKLGSQENGDIDEDLNESDTTTVTPVKEVKSSVMNFLKHKVNMVNIDEPKSLGRTQSTDSKADSKASFHSTFQSPQASNKAVDKIAPVKKSVNISPMPAQVAHLNTTYDDDEDDDEFDDESEEEDPEEEEARQRQEYRKSMAAATFNVDLFDIDDPDNTLTQVLLYLENQTVKVISTTQSLLSAIKHPQVTKDVLRSKAGAITDVISQMTEATNTSMNQTRNAQLKEHGSWVVRSLEDCSHRMNILCKVNPDESDATFADKNFKQRLAGISFDIAKCTKELVKTVEEATLKEEIANLNARLSRQVE